MKKMFKSIMVLSMIAILAITMVGCGSKTETNSDEATEQKQSTEAKKEETKSSEKFTIRIAHNQQSDQGYGIGVAKMKEILEEKAGDRIELQIFDNGVLGNERDVTEGLKMGTVDMCITSVGVASNFEPTLAAINLPFLVKNNEHLNNIVESNLMQPAYDNFSNDR